MKAIFVAAAVLLLILLPACGGSGGEDGFEAWRQTVDSVSMEADVTAAGGENAAVYTLGCKSASGGAAEVTVLAPENIAGVTASRTESGVQLEYDGMMLSMGGTDGLTPVDALPLLADAIRTGHLAACYTEPDGDGELLAAELESGGVTVRLWLEPESMTPLCAEFDTGGSVQIKANITKWSSGTD